MKSETYIPRFIQPRLEAAMRDTPVVLVHGPRQCGKTTLVRHLGDQLGYSYLSFDDEAARRFAQDDPLGFVAGLPDKIILDEVQRVPGLFSVIKMEVDRERKPGRFILTGSANVLLIPRLSDSLAGRMEIIRLHPLSRCEVGGEDSGFLARTFDQKWGLVQGPRLNEALAGFVAGGGYPEALARKQESRRAAWYREYVNAIIQRDIRDLARIRGLDSIPKIMEMVALQSGQLFNLSQLAGPFELSRPTIGEYVTLLEGVFLVNRIQPWLSNKLRRLIKTPKIHLGDTGLGCALMGMGSKDLMEDRKVFGRLLETFVFQELQRQASWQEAAFRFSHFRQKDGAEVDIVMERGLREIAGVEVKLSGTVGGKDFNGLRKLQEATGSRFKTGIILYDGENGLRFGENLYALPIWTLWSSR
jgi:predicted AAA+ superfamily ATPase